MKLHTFILCLCFWLPLAGQNSVRQYIYPGGEFEGVFNYDPNNVFDKRDSAFSLLYYKYNESTEKPELAISCNFSFLNAGVIKTVFENPRGKKYRAYYWKFVPNEKGDTIGYIGRCSKDGKFGKNGYPNSTPGTIKVEKINGDSIVVEWDNPFMDKYIYRHNILIEKWHQWTLVENNWQNISYNIEKYTYTGDTVYTERISVAKDGTQTSNQLIKEVKRYNGNGQIVSWLQVFYNKSSNYKGIEEYRYYYRTDGRWYKSETWANGVLTEITEKKMAAPKITKPR